jgi:hypothetical protein
LDISKSFRTFNYRLFLIFVNKKTSNMKMKVLLSLLGAFLIFAYVTTVTPSNKAAPEKAKYHASNVTTPDGIRADFDLACAPDRISFKRPSTPFERVPGAPTRAVSYRMSVLEKSNSPPIG